MKPTLVKKLLDSIKQTAVSSGLVKVSHENLLTVWIYTEPSLISSCKTTGKQAMWKTLELEGGLTLFTCPARINVHDISLGANNDMNYLHYRFNFKGEWIGDLSTDTIKNFASKGADITEQKNYFDNGDSKNLFYNQFQHSALSRVTRNHTQAYSQ